MFLLVGKFYKKQILKFMVKADTNYEKGSMLVFISRNSLQLNKNNKKFSPTTLAEPVASQVLFFSFNFIQSIIIFYAFFPHSKISGYRSASRSRSGLNIKSVYRKLLVILYQPKS